MRSRKEISAQETIPVLRAYPNGVLRTGARSYVCALSFGDHAYTLLGDDGRQDFFDAWCAFLNRTDPAVHLTFSYASLPDTKGPDAYVRRIPERHDRFATVANEYDRILRSKEEAYRSGYRHTRLLLLGTESDSPEEAKTRLASSSAAASDALAKLGIRSSVLSRDAYLSHLYACLHAGHRPDRPYDPVSARACGTDVRDFLAPGRFFFSKRRTEIGDRLSAAFRLTIESARLSDRVLCDLLSQSGEIQIALSASHLDPGSAVRMIRRKMTDLQKMKIEEQKKAVRAGYDPDILPADLVTYGEEAKELLDAVGQKAEQLFRFRATLLVSAEDERTLSSQIARIGETVRGHGCALLPLDFEQETGLLAALPLGIDGPGPARDLPTSAVAAFLPFTSGELTDPGCGALYGGVDRLTGRPLFYDRKTLKNPNGLILGTPGSGKSFTAKREILNVFLSTDDDILVCDPEDEYRPLCLALGGQVVRLSPQSEDGINPMDLNRNYGDGADPVRFKSDFLLSFLACVAGREHGLDPIEKTVADRAVRDVYRAYLADPAHTPMPILGDLHQALLTQHEPEAAHLAGALEIYVTGSLSVFNRRTTVKTGSRILCYDIKDLGSQLKELGMLLVQDQVWNRVTANRASGRATRYYVDEFHLLLRDRVTAEFLAGIWKRFRKWGGIPTGITQNVKDLLASDTIQNILENSDYLCLLAEAPGDRQILEDRLSLSAPQIASLTQCGEGEGLVGFGGVFVPFADDFPRDSALYRLMTTKPSEQPSPASVPPRILRAVRYPPFPIQKKQEVSA